VAHHEEEIRLGAVVAALCSLLVPQLVVAQEGDPAVLARMQAINQQLRARGLGIAVEQIEFFTIGGGRPANRIHAQEFRWVAAMTNVASPTATGSPISWTRATARPRAGSRAPRPRPRSNRALDTWQANRCFEKVDIVKRADSGADPDIFDSFFGFGGFGNPFLADIVEAGWLPRAFFEAVGGPAAGAGSSPSPVTFIFTDAAGAPTDVNGDNRLDTALNEVYYNNTFGDPADNRAGNPWGIDVLLPGIDVETVALHENGHSLGIGHFGPPPAAVMNPVYAGIRQSPLAVDSAGMCSVFSSWPK
jgi:hypothetical protein